MSLVDTYNLKAISKAYILSVDTVKAIFEDMVEKKTGIAVQLEVGCYDEYDFDVFVKLEDDYENNLTDEEFEKINEYINTEEWFMTRDQLEAELFGTENVWQTYDFEIDYIKFEVSIGEKN